MSEDEEKRAREARNAYARKWRAANPDKVRANNDNYWLRKANKDAAKQGADVERKGSEHV